MEFWIVERPGDAETVRQIVVTKPDNVDAADCRDRIDILDAFCGLYQRDHHRARVRLGDLVGLGPVRIVIVRRHIESGPVVLPVDIWCSQRLPLPARVFRPNGRWMVRCPLMREEQTSTFHNN